MDGLLVDSESLYLKATAEVLATVGVEISREWYMRENLAKGTSTFDLAVEKGVSQEEIERLRTRRHDRYAEILQAELRTMDGVPEVLELLRGKLFMGIVTSSHKSHFNVIMEKTGLRKYFSFFITGDDVEHTKPHPEPYLKALKLSGLQPSECLVLEDSCRGVQAAKAAGLTCFAIPDALTKEHDFSIADKVLGSMRELPELILS